MVRQRLAQEIVQRLAMSDLEVLLERVAEVSTDGPAAKAGILDTIGCAFAGTGKGAAMDVIVEMLGWLSGYAAEVGWGLKRGDVIITGARLGPLSVAEAGTYRASCALYRSLFCGGESG